jgi:hypothetical protein
MNLIDLRTAVHVQTQTTTGDLPDATIDSFLAQAYARTVNGEMQWPFFETHWDVSLDPDATTITIPANVNQAGIMALYDLTNNFRLVQVAPEFADDHYIGPQVGTNYPVQFAVWGDTIHLYPRVQTSAVTRPYRLRGYRFPLTWLTPANEPDCDQRLHIALIHYACALAYAQQEDETLESSYMDRWMRDAEAARAVIMEPRHQRPLIYSGSIEAVPSPVTSWVLTPP